MALSRPRMGIGGTPSRWIFLAATVLVAASMITVSASISGLQSQTFDEPTHVATGLEWLQRGRYTLWTETPPLARVVVALGPYLHGVRLDDGTDSASIGNAALYRDGAHDRHLIEARLGTLPFFVLLLGIVGFWTARAGSPAATFGAVTMTATLPPLIAHAALATTDVAFTAVFVAATYSYVRWLEAASPRSALQFGMALGLAIATKFSTLMFFPPAALTIAAVRLLLERRGAVTSGGRRLTIAQVGAIAAGAAIIVWAIYRFSIGTIADLPAVRGSRVSADQGFLFALVHRIEHTPLPAPEFPHGLLELIAHDARGQRAYALGTTSERGFWFFYPLAFAVKTPWSFFGFAAFAVVAVRASWRDRADWSTMAALAAAAAIFGGVLASRVNLGLRHILAVYPLIAIASAFGIAALVRSSRPVVRICTLAALTLLVAAQGLTLWRVHPHELAYFNPIAGTDPGALLVDSDLDWGQDLGRLEAVAHGFAVDHLYIAYFGTARLCEHTLPPVTWLPPGRPQSGWIAISENYYRGAWHAGRRDVCDVASGWINPRYKDDYSWLAPFTPVAVAGKSIRVYHIPAAGIADR